MSQISPVQARESISRSTETDSIKIARFELATCRAENYFLRQRMTECEASIQSLNKTVANIAEQQLVVLNEVLELRKDVVLMQPKKVADASTSTAQDGIAEPEGYLQDSDTEYLSPQGSSDSETEFEPPLEQYDLATKTSPPWSILYSIKEEIEPEDSQEDVIDYQDEPEQQEQQQQKEENSQPLADEGDN